MARSKALAALFLPDYRGVKPESIYLKTCWTLASGNRHGKRVVLFSPGFGAGVFDYGPVVRSMERDSVILRVHHPGSARASFLQALAIFTRARFQGQKAAQAARKARLWIHREENRRRRVEQLREVFLWAKARYPEKSVVLAGHSFGTDTALLGALAFAVDRLILLSPHPPGYLIEAGRYSRLSCPVSVLVGSEDWTRDGVGPQDRLKVVEALPASTDSIVLAGVRHMDFAFSGLGPVGWESHLQHALGQGCP